MKKILFAFIACGSLFANAQAYELTETEKKQASSRALGMTAMDVFCLCTVTPLTFEAFNLLAAQLLTSNTGFISGFVKGAGLGVGLISAAGLSELLKIVCLADPRFDSNAEAINSFALEKNVQYRKEILGWAIAGGILGALCMK
jgi:hypothetical protein